MSRDWARERWRKQYLREPLQERLWPVMARGLRELLNMLTEEDGTLIRDADEPEIALVAALAPKPEELELVHAAVALLVREGFLGSDDRSIWIPELPASQTSADVRRIQPEPSNTIQPAPAPRQPDLSTERVRRHLAKKRAQLGADEFPDGAAPGVPARITVSGPVSTSVSSSLWRMSRAVPGSSRPDSPPPMWRISGVRVRNAR